MEIEEAMDLIRPGLPVKSKSTWADLGCGPGVFTNALAAFLDHGSTINAVDKSNQNIPMRTSEVAIKFFKLDIEKDQLPFNNLDGILMANSLHYVKDKSKFVEKLVKHLKSDG